MGCGCLYDGNGLAVDMRDASKSCADPHFVLDGCCKVAEIAPVSYMVHIWPILGHGLGMGQGGVQPKNLVRNYDFLRLFSSF